MHRPGDRNVFLAGTAGAIGNRLVPLLLQRGWQVVGTTRSTDKAKVLGAAGVEPAVVLHQLTDLPAGLDPVHMAEAIARNARIRSEGTANLARKTRSTLRPRASARSVSTVLRNWRDAYSARRRSRASCSDTDVFTDLVLAPTSQLRSHRCTSTQRLGQQCWPWNAAHPASTTSPTPVRKWIPTRRGRNWIGAPTGVRTARDSAACDLEAPRHSLLECAACRSAFVSWLLPCPAARPPARRRSTPFPRKLSISAATGS